MKVCDTLFEYSVPKYAKIDCLDDMYVYYVQREREREINK